MRHYVLTRAVYDPEAWPLEANRRRLDLLRAVTAASLSAQTEKRWSWIVAVHPDDPLLAERKAVCRAAGYKARFVAYRGEGDRVATAARAYRSVPWRRHMAAPDRPTLTTRLDDDDALAPRTLGRVRKAARHLERRTALIAPEGFRVFDGRYVAVRHERNAWASLLAPAGDGALVYDFNHKRIAEHVPVVFLADDPAWLWVRHDDTLSRHRIADAPIDDRLRAHFPNLDWRAIKG